MNDRDWELANAYADDELGSEQRASFERRLEEDAALRDAVATVMILKTGVQAMKEHEAPGACNRSADLVSDIDPGMRPSDAEPRRPLAARRVRMAISFAAALALFVVAGAAYQFVTETEGSWETRSVAVHDSMSAKPFAIQERDAVEFVSARGFSGMPVPDLRPSSLFYAGMDAAPDHLALHYRGRNGCSLTLMAMTGPAIHETADGMPANSANQHLFRTWVGDPYRYVVIAQGMDRERFETIADFIRSDLRLKRDAVDQLRVAMADAYRQSAPCA